MRSVSSKPSQSALLLLTHLGDQLVCSDVFDLGGDHGDVDQVAARVETLPRSPWREPNQQAPKRDLVHP